MYWGFIEAIKAQLGYLFDNTDRLEYLSYCRVENNIGGNDELRGSELEAFARAFISVGKGESWGMKGLIFKFKVTEEIHRFFVDGIESDKNFSGFLYLDNDKKKYLENPTYYKFNEKKYSYCTHEGYEDGDKSFIASLDKAYITGAKKDILYQTMIDKAILMPLEFYKNKNRLMRIFHQLESYIAQERKDYVFSCPMYECSFGQFMKYAQYTFTEDIMCELVKCKSFIEISKIFPFIEEKYFAELYYLDLVKVHRV